MLEYTSSIIHRLLSRILITALLCVPVLALPAGGEEVVVIMNNENSNVIDRDYVIRIYTGSVKV